MYNNFFFFSCCIECFAFLSLWFYTFRQELQVPSMAPALSVGEGERGMERSFICLGFISHVRRVSDEFRYPSDVSCVTQASSLPLLLVKRAKQLQNVNHPIFSRYFYLEGPNHLLEVFSSLCVFSPQSNLVNIGYSYG